MTSDTYALSFDTVQRRVFTIWAKAGATMAAASAIFYLGARYRQSTEIFFLRQDLPALLVSGLILIALRWFPRVPNQVLSAPPRTTALLLALACLAVGVVGAPLVFQGYELSLDEFLAGFDARIFAHGQLMAPTSVLWRPFLNALGPRILQVAGGSFWVSPYLPLNTALRSVAMAIGAQTWVNPALSALSILALFAVARRLWPERPSMALRTVFLLATSSQLLIMSMTAYAMPAQLFLNLVWLWCFLRGGRFGHLGALAVAFVACGLHQLIFHPLFAAPFVLQLWLDRRWRLASLYTLSYAAICLFWLMYSSLLLRSVGFAPAHATVSGMRLDSAVLDLLRRHNILVSICLMVEALLRFMTWQNPLAVPLALIGAGAAMRLKGTFRALALGVWLTIGVALLLEPSQVQGWGYRYLHGLLGSVCLLAVLGWDRMMGAQPPEAQTRANAAFVWACVASVAILLPLRAWQAYRYAHPYAVANALVQHAPAQVVIVDDNGLWFDSGSVLRNDPYLERGPKVMALQLLDPPALRAICSRYSVVIFDGREAEALGIDILRPPVSPEVAELRALAVQLGCGKRLT